MTNRKGFAPIIIILVVAALVGSATYLMQVKRPYKSPSFGNTGAEVTIRGVVVENSSKLLLVDGAAYLRVRDQSKREVKVVYNPGEAQCLNRDNEGLAIRVGQDVEVFGKLTTGNVISLCDSENYYIHNVPQGSAESNVPVDWKTYRNEQYGFEVKYPSGWGDVEKKTSEYNSLVMNIIFGKGRSTLSVVQLSPASTTFTVEDYIKTHMTKDRISVEDITVDNLPAKKIYSYSQIKDQNEKYVSSGEIVITITFIHKGIVYSWVADGNIEYILLSMMSTFKFTK